jgi:hypothetical protein
LKSPNGCVVGFPSSSLGRVNFPNGLFGSTFACSGFFSSFFCSGGFLFSSRETPSGLSIVGVGCVCYCGCLFGDFL